MDFFTAARICARRWYVVLSALGATALIALSVMNSVASSYEARGSVLLFAPSAQPDDAGAQAVNPFRSFDSSTSLLAAVVVQVMDDATVRERVAEQGGNADYEVGQTTDGAPVIVVVATDPDEGLAIRTVGLALDALDDELDERQAEAGAPPEIRIRAIALTAPTATELVGGRIRAFLAVVAIGVAGSVSLAFIVESVAQGRRRRSEGTFSADASDAEGPPLTKEPATPVPTEAHRQKRRRLLTQRR